MSRALTGLTSGMLAGAAGATALNLFTYTQQAVQGTPSGATPDQAAQAVVQSVGAEVPGTPDQVQNRLEGLGPISGLGVGLGIGALGGLLRALGVKIPITAAPVVLGLGAMAISDGVMTAVGVTDPRTWTVGSVVQDALPHLVYGAVTVLALHRMIDHPPSRSADRGRLGWVAARQGEVGTRASSPPAPAFAAAFLVGRLPTRLPPAPIRVCS